MKKLFIVVVLSFLAMTTYAQIPYFAGTAGDGNIYAYTSLKFRPSVNAQESYTTFQYGITDYAAVGTDIYSYNNSVYWGFLARGGYKFNKWYGIGLQATPSFDMGNNFEFNYLTLGLYQNGAITSDGNLFWVSNTWAGINRYAENTWNQWWYLGYYVDFKDKGGIAPMVGILHDWKFENKVDVAAGFYYTYKDWNFYVWGNNFFEENPRIVIGVDFKLKTRK